MFKIQIFIKFIVTGCINESQPVARFLCFFARNLYSHLEIFFAQCFICFNVICSYRPGASYYLLTVLDSCNCSWQLSYEETHPFCYTIIGVNSIFFPILLFPLSSRSSSRPQRFNFKFLFHLLNKT